MQGTRILWNKAAGSSSSSVGTVVTAAALRHKNYVFPTRSAWDVWYAAANAGVSLMMNQKSRDDFVSYANDGIINPQVLSQADLGYSMTLALYHDLTSPLLRDISIRDFMEGIHPAIENYEEVLTSLESRDLNHSNDKTTTTTTTTTATDDDSNKDPSSLLQEKDNGDSSNNNNNSSDDVIEKGKEGDDTKDNWEHQLFTNLDAMEDEAAAILKQDLNWKDSALNQSDSLEGQLHTMVSEECFENIQKDPRRILLHANRRMTYQEETGEIRNVALLSARAMEVLPDDEDMEEDAAKELLKTGGDDSSFSKGIEKPLPVVAEMEVLYSVAQTFQTTPIVTEHLNDSDDTNDSDDAPKKNDMTVNSVWVAVLHGWLRGDPSGNKELRWKLVNNRPAVEFAGIYLPTRM